MARDLHPLPRCEVGVRLLDLLFEFKLQAVQLFADVDVAVLGQGVQHLDLFFDFVDLFFKIQNGGLVFTHSSFLFPIFLQLVL